MIKQKLYSPLYVKIHDYDNEEYYDCDYWCDDMSQQEAADYYDEIHVAILKERLSEETGRGLMAYYHGSDSVNDKVRSLFVDVEVHEGRLWGVATINVKEDLNLDELHDLRQYISGQYSDGFGEGFEQREVKTGNGELYVSLWSHESSFRIMTEEEFCAHLWPEQVQDITQGM